MMFDIPDLTRGRARRYRWVVVGLVVLWLVTQTGLGYSLMWVREAGWPVWLGIASMVGIGAAWVGWLGPWMRRAAERRDRARAGTCEKCGYPLGDLPPRTEPAAGLIVDRPACPECGHRQL